MNPTRRRAAISGGPAMAGLAAVVAGFAALGAAADMDGRAAGDGGTVDGVMPEAAIAGAEAAAVEAAPATLEEELSAVRAERDAVLRGLGVSPPGMDAAAAAEVRSRAAPILDGYVAAFAGGALPSATTVASLNAEYDALLAEYGAAPQGLDESQIRPFTEHRAAEILTLDRIRDRHGGPGSSRPADPAAIAPEHMGVSVDPGKVGVGIERIVPWLTVEQELTLAMRLAPLDQRHGEILRELEAGGNADGNAGALNSELATLEAQGAAVAAAASPALPDPSEVRGMPQGSEPVR